MPVMNFSFLGVHTIGKYPRQSFGVFPRFLNGSPPPCISGLRHRVLFGEEWRRTARWPSLKLPATGLYSVAIHELPPCSVCRNVDKELGLR